MNNTYKTQISSYKRGMHLLAYCCITAFLFGCNTTPSIDITSSPTIDTSSTVSTTSDKDALAYELALQLIKIKKYKKAEFLLVKLSKQQSSPNTLANLALVHYKLKKLDSAETYINRALLIKQDHIEYLNIAGLIAIEKGNFKQAEDHYRSAIAIDGKYAYPHYNLALLYDIYYQDINEAYKHYSRYLELINYKDKETVEWLEQLSYSLKQEGQT